MEGPVAFNLHRFLAHLAADALERHFAARHPEVARPVDWTGPPEHVRASLEGVILTCARGRDDLISSLERVHLLADGPGDRAMVAACGPDEALVEGLRALGSAHERALWLLERHDRLFERAEESRYADLYAGAGRRWTGFLGPRARWPELEGGRLDRFQDRLEAAFRRLDGSGSSPPSSRSSAARRTRGATARGRCFNSPSTSRVCRRPRPSSSTAGSSVAGCARRWSSP
jgi:hypothetical protein